MADWCAQYLQREPAAQRDWPVVAHSFSHYDLDMTPVEVQVPDAAGGVMDGDSLGADEVLAVSKWPNREEQISMLVGQILGPGASLSAQMLGAGSTLAGQIKKLVEDKEGEA